MDSARDRPVSGQYSKVESEERPRALLAVEDDVTRRALHSALVADGWDVVHARTASDLLRLLRATARLDLRGYQLVVCAVRTTHRSELDVLADVLHLGDFPVLFVTRLADEATRRTARGLGATWVLSWPVRLDELRGAAAFAARRFHGTEPERDAG